MSLPFTKSNEPREDEPSVSQEKRWEGAKRLWGCQFFIRISFHKVTKIERTQAPEMKAEVLRLAPVAGPGPAPEPPAPAPSTETQTTDKYWLLTTGVMPPNDGPPG